MLIDFKFAFKIACGFVSHLWLMKQQYRIACAIIKPNYIICHVEGVEGSVHIHE